MGFRGNFLRGSSRALVLWVGVISFGCTVKVVPQKSASSTSSSNGSGAVSVSGGGGGAVTSLSFSTQPSATGDTDTALAAQPVINLLDASLAVVTSASSAITLTAYSDACTTAVASGLSAATNPVTAASGVATFSNLKILKTNVTHIGASDGTHTVCSTAFVISPGAAASIAVNTGNNQSAKASTSLAASLTSIVKDANGNPVGAGTTVNWSIASGGGALTAASSLTNAAGVAAIGYTLGASTITASISATVNLTAFSISFTERLLALNVVGPVSGATLTPTTASAVIVYGTCSENGRVVSIAASTVTASPTCTSGHFTATLDLSALGNGSITVTVDHSNGTVGVTQVSRTITKTASACAWTGTDYFQSAVVNNSCFTGNPSSASMSTWASGTKIYYATFGYGLGISTDGGTTWTTKTTSNGLASNLLNWVVGDNAGRIYVGSNNGLSISTDSGATWAIRTTSDGLPSNTVYGIALDASRIYVATAGGVAVSNNLSATSFTGRTTVAGLGSNTVYSIAVNASTIFAGTAGGVSVSTDLTGASFTNQTTGLANTNVYSIALDSSHIYAGTAGGLAISTNLTGASFSNKTTAQGLPFNRVTGIALDSNGKLYADTAAGIGYSTDGGASFINRPSANSSWGIFVDLASNRLYVPTDNSGLNYSDNFGATYTALNRDSKTTYGNHYGQTNGDFYVDANGLIYGGARSTLNTVISNGTTGFGGLSKSSDAGMTFDQLWSFPSAPTAVYVDSSFYIYASIWNGFYISKDGGSSFSSIINTANGLGSNTINKLFADQNGTIYVSTTAGLSISTDGGITFTNKTTGNGLGSNTINDVYADGAGNIYVATSAGVSISNDSGTSFTNRTMATGLGSNSVNAIAVSGVRIYAGTSNGISVSTDLTGATFSNKTTAQGLGSNTVNALAIDGTQVFVGTANGVSVSSDLTGTSYTNYTSGLGDLDVRRIYARNGKVYAGTLNGGLAIH